MKKTKEQKGITLIALIITIVILLILAVVTINAIKGNGIIDYARKARDDYKKEQDDESSILEHYLELIDGSQSNLIEHEGIIPEGGAYWIEATDTIINAGEKFPANITLNDGYEFGDYWYVYNGEYWNVEGVIDQNKTEYGEIIGKINGKYVTSMKGTFANCTSLIEAPVIPNSVTNIGGAFYNCTSLEVAPKIPSSVITMSSRVDMLLGELYGCFQGCTSLKTPPDMSDATNVTDINCAFKDCTSLTVAPVIPESVRNMGGTFCNCTSLTVAPKIPSNVLSMCCYTEDYMNSVYGCFENCISLETPPDMSNAVNLTDMNMAFYGCASLTVAPAIPESVIEMGGTFGDCSSLVSAPIIPNSVKSMCYERVWQDFGNHGDYSYVRTGCFQDCTSLTGSITINANPTSWTMCLYNTKITSVVGDTTMASSILKTVSSTATNPT